MFLFNFLKKEKERPNDVVSANERQEAAEGKWQEVPAYIETTSDNYQLVSVIATAIAAGDRPESQFVVKRILERNPEAKLVSLISASTAAIDYQKSRLVVKKMQKKIVR
ncbi:hypothetical protein GIX45_25835 [Erwinia sp. CPCC 100877]|nr:hypothetical protein [Erwinia sp. CPCC 100877]